MDESKDHVHHYWIRHKDGYLFCGVCKKKQESVEDNADAQFRKSN